MKVFFKRLEAFMLSLAMVLAIISDLGFTLPIFAASMSSKPEANPWYATMLALDVIHRSADDSLYTYHDVFYHTSSSFDDDYYDENYVSYDEETGIITVRPLDRCGVFDGFAVLAGNDIVSFDTENGEEVLKINYKSVIDKKTNTHEVKINVFYMEKPQYGANFLGSGSGSGTGDENDVCYIALGENGKILEREHSTVNDAVEDRFYIVDADWVSTDIYGELSLNKSDFKKAYGFEAEGVAKLYNTSSGLHTDKTVYATEASGDGISGSREFDVTLESWYGGNATADIGLILDASGSMAFSSARYMVPMQLRQGRNITDREEAFKWLDHDTGYNDYKYMYDKQLSERAQDKYGDFTLDYDEDTKTYTITTDGKGYYENATYTFKANEYLPQEIVDMLLKPTDTDNSRLGYSGYSYYVYDRRASHSEFNPLGYWGGKVGKSDAYTITTDYPAPEEMIGHYTFDSKANRLANTAPNADEGATGVFIKHPSEGNYYADQTPVKYSEVKISTDTADIAGTSTGEEKSIKLNSMAKEYGIMLDAVPTSENFTFSIAVKTDKVETKTKTNLFTIGANGTAKVGLQAIHNGDSARRLKFGDYSTSYSPSAYNIREAFHTRAHSDQINGFQILTFVVEGNTSTIYINGNEILYKDLGDDPESPQYIKKTVTALTDPAHREIVIGGFWNTAYNSKNILIDEVFVYDKALSAKEVSQLYKALNGPQVAAKSKYVALDDNDNIIANISDSFKDGDPDDMRGWYYVNSSSKWNDYYANPEISTAKEFKAVPNNEVIPNEINYDYLPENVKVFLKNTSNVVEMGNGGFIYTGSNDFTVKKSDKNAFYYYVADQNSGKPSSFLKGVSAYNDHMPDDLENNKASAAIKLPESVSTRSGSSTSYNASPVIFFVDDKGFLRCFFSNGETPTKETDNGPRSSVSYVYFKWDCDDVKTDSLQSALGIFNADLENISPSSRVSAVRFSSSEVKDDTASLSKLVMLDWTKDPTAATKMLSLEYGDGSSTASELSTTSLGNENSKLSPIEQYNYGLTGGTSTYQGLKAFQDILVPRMGRDDPDRDEGKSKYVIVFTDGKDTNVEDTKSSDEKERQAAETSVEGSKTIHIHI